MTPEGKTKSKIDKILTKYHIYSASNAGAFPEDAEGWVFKPVQGSSFGVSGIPDYLGHYQGTFFGIEAKAPGKKPTGFQSLQLAAIAASGGAVFVVSDEESLGVFEAWLKKR